MRVMAIDYGTKAVGVAISDELQLTVRPLTTIRREKHNHMPVVERVSELAIEHEISVLVVGLPLNMNGTRGDAAEKVETFVAGLRPHLTIPIILIDERLTSYEADQILREMGIGQKERKAKSDEYAAVLILQDYLDGQLRQKTSDPSSTQSFQ
jgi:putative Holliday junction resolvase